MSKILDSAVTRSEDDTWAFQCPGITGSVCGAPASGRPFHSSGWPTKKIAQARGAQHFASHQLGAVITEAVEAARAEAEDPEAVDAGAIRDEVLRTTKLKPSTSLDEFRAEHGLVAHSNGIHAVRIEDLA